MRTLLVATFVSSLLVVPPGLAAETLHQGKPFDYWKKKLGDSSAAERHEAAEAFAQVGAEWAKKAVPELTRALGDDDATLRIIAARALARCEAEAAPAVPALLKALEKTPPGADGDPHRWQFIGTLGSIGPKAKEAVPVLARLIGSGDQTDYAVAAALGRIGPDARATLPVLMALARDENGSYRASAAALAVAAIAPDSSEFEEAVRLLVRREGFISKGRNRCPLITGDFWHRHPDLFLKHVPPLLKNDDAVLRVNAARALGIAGAMAKEAATRPLLEALKDDEGKVCGAAALALNAVNPDESGPAVPVVAKLLGSGQMPWTEAFYFMRSRAAEAAPLVLRELDGKSETEQAPFVSALFDLQPASAPVVEAALADPSMSIRRGAAVVVGRRGPDAASAIPALLKLTADEDAGVRLVAVESLLYVDASRAELGRWLPVVETFVREKNPPVQSRAFSVLRALGPAATSLWPSMLEAMNESTGELRLQMALAWTRVNIEKHSTAFPILLEAVKTPTSPQLLDVVDTLGTLRKTAKEALPALRRILADDKRPPEFRWRLCLALVRIDRGEIAACLPVMQAILNKDQRRNYRLVDPILSLVEWGPDARSIGSDLRAIIGQEPVPERVALAAAITCVLIDGDQDEAARKFIRQVVEKPEEANERRELLYLLGRLGPRAKVFAPEVRALLKDPEHANEARQLLAKLES